MESDEKNQKNQRNNSKNNKKQYHVNNNSNNVIEMIESENNDLECYGDERMSNNNRKRVYNLNNLNNMNNNNMNHTDQSNNKQYQHQHYKQIISRCTQCKSKVQQFVTKKPYNRSYNNINNVNHLHFHQTTQSTQTTQKPFLIDLIEQRIQIICRKNTKLQELLQTKQQQIIDKQQQLNEIQQKFTTIIYTLGQQLCYLKIKQKDQEEIKQVWDGQNAIGNGGSSLGVRIKNDTDVPAYLKMLVNDRKQ